MISLNARTIKEQHSKCKELRRTLINWFEFKPVQLNSTNCAYIALAQNFHGSDEIANRSEWLLNRHKILTRPHDTKSFCVRFLSLSFWKDDFFIQSRFFPNLSTHETAAYVQFQHVLNAIIRVASLKNNFPENIGIFQEKNFVLRGKVSR